MVNLAYAAALLVLGLVPVVPGQGLVGSDVLVHGLASGAQALMLFWLLTTMISPMMAVISSGLGAFLFGSMVEVLQIFQPARYFQLGDLVASAVGSILVCAAIGLLLAYKREIAGRAG